MLTPLPPIFNTFGKVKKGGREGGGWERGNEEIIILRLLTKSMSIVLKEFTDEERAKFLRFVYGALRLPPSDRGWKMDFTIRAFCGAGDPDDSLPTSQVFFLFVLVFL